MNTPITPDAVDAVVAKLKAEAVALAGQSDPSYVATVENLIDLLGGIAVNLARIAAAGALKP
jgi:hypothetical protein